MIQGLESTLIWYAMTAAVQLAMHYFSSSARQGQTTRIYLFFALFAAELSLLFSPRSRTFFDLVFPSRCIYQHVALLQQLWITASLAINQIVPLWSTGTTETTTVRDPKAEEQLQLLLERSIIMAREMEMNDAKGMQEDVQSLVQQGTKQGLPEQVVKGLTKKEIEENTIDVLLSRLPPNSKGRITTLGMFIIDTFSFLTDSGDPVASDARKEKQPQIGGGGTYFIIGARIFLPPSRLGQIIHYTPETCPEWMLEDLKSYEVDDMSEDVDQQGNGCQPEGKPQGMFQFTLRPDGLGTTTAENIYRGEARDFKFLTPGYRMWPRDLVDSSFFSNDHGQGNSGVDGAQSKSSVGSSTISTNSNTPSTSPPSMVHFTAFPGRAKEILDQLDEIAASDGKGNGWRPDTIYEIFPVSHKTLPPLLIFKISDFLTWWLAEHGRHFTLPHYATSLSMKRLRHIYLLTTISAKSLNVPLLIFPSSQLFSHDSRFSLPITSKHFPSSASLIHLSHLTRNSPSSLQRKDSNLKLRRSRESWWRCFVRNKATGGARRRNLSTQSTEIKEESSFDVATWEPL